jgi:cysteine-rich repeat protein
MTRLCATLAALGIWSAHGCFKDEGPGQGPDGSTGTSAEPSTGAPTGEPAVCGDGVVADGEACDDGELNAIFGACGLDCALNVCGDGVPGPEEDCDDGNRNDGDACRNTCERARCGDAVVQDGELCDDGDADEDDGCTSKCAPPTCGDGVLSGMEACDLAERNADDGLCTSECEEPACGDGTVQPGEACEPATAGCAMNCRWPTCNNMMLDPGEFCDGESEDCTNFCTAPRCGDDLTSPDETCDDGNGLDGDDCSATCQVSVCGDGVVADDEPCDDMNVVAGDGCSESCTRDALFVFVTSATYQGAEVGELTGADTHCQKLANKADLPGTYRAWLSDGEASPATRFTKGKLPYILPAGLHGLGVRVARDWVDLVDGTLERPINVTETGDMLIAGESCGAPALLAWTHTGATAGPQEANASCGGWKFSINSVGSAGMVNRSDAAWTEGCGEVVCTMALHLYCVEQRP